MIKINSLYDALIKTNVEEDQCTYFLVWLLQKLPPEVVSKICEKSKLSMYDKISNKIIIDVQHPLENSRPDARVEFSDNKYILIETKIYPKRFDKIQFVNHFNGGCKKFGEKNTWLLFLSGDNITPDELKPIIQKNQGKIGHISWNSLREILIEYNKTSDEKFKIIIEEFLVFAKHYKLGRLISLDNEEMNQFIESFSEWEKYRKPCTDKLLYTLDMYIERIKDDSPGKVEEINHKDANNKDLPCLYKCLKIKGWHTDWSCYIFINIVLKKIGVVLTGYEDDDKDKKIFSEIWKKYMKNKYKEDPKLCSLTWIEEDDDKFAINEGYFKVEEIVTKSFIPAETKIFSSHFYFGYIYELNIPELEKLVGTISEDFKTLIERFAS